MAKWIDLDYEKVGTNQWEVTLVDLDTSKLLNYNRKSDELPIFIYEDTYVVFDLDYNKGRSQFEVGEGRDFDEDYDQNKRIFFIVGHNTAKDFEEFSFYNGAGLDMIKELSSVDELFSIRYNKNNIYRLYLPLEERDVTILVTDKEKKLIERIEYEINNL